MKISVIIPFKQDFEIIGAVLENLIINGSEDCAEMEIILVNDGSKTPGGKFDPVMTDHPSITHIDQRASFGIGYSFDRGVERATGDVIVLMGADVFPHLGWYEIVRNGVLRNPETIGCAVCVGDKSRADGTYSHNYGADLLITMDVNDLPLSSKIREQQPKYRDLFKARWADLQRGEEPWEIPCLLGAFYFCTKEYYTKLGGWDTLPGNRFRGHRQYGHLEPHLSLKSWLGGSGCLLYPHLKARHVFSRVSRENRYAKGARSMENIWWNALWIGETCVLDPALREKILNYPHNTLNYGVAKNMIRRNYDQVLEVRAKNEKLFVKDIEYFCNKFGYNLKLE